MSGQAYEQLTLFPAGSPASHSVKPGSDEARRMTVTSGQRCCELFRKSGPLGSLARMLLESSIWHSTRCFLTWKPSATPGRRLLFRLVPSTPRTEETGSPLWPTPTTGAGLCGGTGNFQTLKTLEACGVITEEERRSLSAGNGGNTNPAFLEWLMGYEQMFTTQLLPTPTASDYKGAPKNRVWRERERERENGIQGPVARANRADAVWENWPDEPDICRVAHGVPNRVDRLRCLGNAVVPQQFYPVFAAIRKEMECGLTE